ncbi:MAG: SUMF1/EgtB/PvdO family nonheme iron enzyme [Pseudomonadota bacterium]|nr:SUMF1/EgtB/PvdO family nonheme iron enzyme [Pseudomonadota bacterium]
MTAPAILGQLSGLHDMMRELASSVPAADANRRFHPQLASLNWYLGRTVFRETYWLREVLADDADLTDRVRDIFTPGALDPDEQCARLPPLDHLLNWAQEIEDEHLRRLANPRELPAHPMLEADRLQWFLLQETARDYEMMLTVLLARRLAESGNDYRVLERLKTVMPAPEPREVVQGHYRIGSREEPFAYDNELPPQAVELASFRIARYPVTNAEYLAFMEAGGYHQTRFWSEDGLRWLNAAGPEAPLHWRRDDAGRWYGVGLNGAGDLQPDDPVSGVNQYEAAAFAAWTAALGGDLGGAVLQHEYQWEVAARSGLIEGTGRAWEWCANPFHPYPKFTPFPDANVSQAFFGGGQISLRGAGLHTQRCLRRASFRNWAAAQERHHFAGIRLVFPPA